MSGNNGKKSLTTHFVAGGGAGFIEAVACHPLDTIKVRMQLRSNIKTAIVNRKVTLEYREIGTNGHSHEDC